MKTRITELLGIKYPIIQAAMAYVAYPSLVAAVSEAGGLGILGATPMSPEELRKSVLEIRELTDKPFGVNFLPYHPQAEELLDVIVEEKVAVASYGRGDPKKIIERTKPHGIVNMPTIGAVRHAVKAEGYGADALVVQGLEAGGHASYVTTTVLLPLVVDRVKVPLVAAGGFADARGLMAALAMGADGISMGTRFAVTKESPIPDNIKQFYLESSENDTIITARVTGTRCRGLKNQLTDMLEEERRGLPLLRSISGLLWMRRAFSVPWWKVLLSGLRMRRAYEIPMSGTGELAHALFGGERMSRGLMHGDRDLGFMPCGQVCGVIEDVPTCKELIERIVYGVEEIMDKIENKIRS